MKLKTLVHGLLLAGLAGTALAQSEQRIEITGSLIKRIAAEGALPLQTITREEIDREGITTAEQLVNYLSTNGTGLDNLASNADVVAGAQRGNNGLSAANLRGQGSSSTLVLLNGRRVAAHGLSGSAVDLNQIPMAAVERVEVLKDGASAIYGTDAIGGVINFILRKNFTGLRVSGFADVTEAGGGNIFRTSIAGGFGNLDRDGYNLLATLSVSDNKALRGDQRDFVNTFQVNKGLSVDTRGTPFATIFPLGASTATTINGATPNGTLVPSVTAQQPFVPGSTTIRANAGINVLDLPGNRGCGVIDGMAPYDDKLWDFPQAQFACAWDTGRAAVLQQPVQSTNLVTRATFRLGNHQLSAELLGSRVESAKRFSNLQLSPNTTTQNFAYPRNADSAAVYDRLINELRPFFPDLAARGDPNRVGGALPIAVRWRCIECGPREIKTTADTGRFFVGADGPLAGSWDYRTGISQAFSKAESQLGGGYYFRNTTRDAQGNVTNFGIIDALNTGRVNMFLLPGETQSAAGLAELEKASARGVVLYGGKYTTSQADFSASGSLFKMAGGEAMAAVGVDVRQEKYEFNGDRRAAQARPIIIAAPFDDANALATVKRDVKAVYGEILLPIWKNFELTGAVRSDDYTGFGRTTNPKVSLRWRPLDQVLLRGSYNEGFRVPNFNQIFNGVTQSFYAGRDIVDPQKCPTLRVDSTRPGCEVVQPDIVTGGKLDLGPETAKQASFGIVIEPDPAFSIGFDWWTIKRQNTIQLLDLPTLINNFALFSNRFLRDPAGNLVIIDQRWINAGESETTGLEVNLRSRGKMGKGSWTAGLDGTYLLEKRSRVIAGQPFGPSEIGVFTFGGDLGLRWKHNAFFTYREGPWSGTISTIYRKGYRNQDLPGVASGLVNPPDAERMVRSYSTFNLSGTYTGIKNLSITAGIKNIFDNNPPFAITYDSSSGAGSSWEPRVADPRGRAYTLRVEYTFF